MQRLRHDAGRTLRAPALVLAIGGIALLPCQTQAQAQTKAQVQVPDRKPLQKEDPLKTAPDKRTIQLGPYTLTLLDTDRNQGFQAFGPGNVQQFRANAVFYLDVSADKPDDMILVDGVENLHGVDDKGRPVRGPENRFPQAMMPRFGAAEGVKRDTLSLQAEDGATSLKTLEGNLIVEAGALRTLTFEADDLHPDTSKKLNGGTVTLDFFKQYSDGEVRVWFTWLYPHISQVVDPLAPRRPQIWNNQRFTVDVIGTDGMTYKNGSRGESSHEARPKGLLSDPANGNGIPVATSIISHIECGFANLPEGVRVKSIVCHIIEQGAGTKSMPFKFTDIPIPARKP